MTTGSSYVCSRCGRKDCEVSLAHPSLDDRFVIGYCERCTPYPMTRKSINEKQPVRSTIPLVRSDLWTPQWAAERNEADSRRRLLQKAFNGVGRAPTETELARAREIMAEQFERAGV